MGKTVPPPPPVRRDGKFEHESAQDARSLAEYLEALSRGFLEGRMRFSSAGTTIEMHPTGLVTFAVEAKAQKGRMKLALRFSWREDQPETAAPPLNIDSGDGESG